MAIVVGLTFNPFEENTYLVYDDTGECIIFDPGCYEGHEKEELVSTINKLQLKPVRLINTHCHIDHVLGNRFVSEAYQLPLEIHEGELPVLQSAPQVAAMFGMPYPEPSPMPGRYIAAGELISFGHTQLKALYTPGHSPASLSFYCEKDGFVIAGDVLFRDSIGRTDLPGGNFNTLATSIKTQFYTLNDEVKVYPGHGPATTIGYEKRNNPFVSN
ncbi:MAG: MBL fold metallo-hydrolase [Saprospiraceae bacterium]|nr:MBL fold metallo-hydrolase [Saprospiraceae bacterium]